MSPDYDKAYRETPAYFGDEPEPFVMKHVHHLDPGLPVLDAGAGQGRNAFFLAGREFRVHALDPSEEAVRILKEGVKRLPDGSGEVKVFHASVFEFAPTVPGYGGVLLIGLIPLLPRGELPRLAELLAQWTAPGGHLLVTAFTRDDPSYSRWAESGRRRDRHSFVGEGGEVRTFLDPGEVTGLFPEFRVLEHVEGLGAPHRHGDGPEERHALARALFRKA